jgi:hypothetical protein
LNTGLATRISKSYVVGPAVNQTMSLRMANGIRAPGLRNAWKRPCSSATVAVRVEPVLVSHQKPASCEIRRKVRCR